MRVIHNRFIPFRRFYAINLFGIVFVRKGTWLSSRELNHERIHTAQMRELLYVGFYVWYVVEWLIRLVCQRNAYHAYRNISFEQEAYSNGDDLGYLRDRRHYAWLRNMK